MLRLSILAITLTATGVLADEPPPVPEGGLAHLYSSPCIDEKSGEEGTCHVMQDREGYSYVTFWQGETLMFIRKIVGDGYETVWVNSIFDSI